MTTKFEVVTYDHMIMAERVKTIDDSNKGERFIGSFGKSNNIFKYIFMYFGGITRDGDLCFCIREEKGGSRLDVPAQKIDDEYAIYRSYEADVQDGSKALWRMSADEFYRKWSTFDAERVHRRNIFLWEIIAKLAPDEGDECHEPEECEESEDSDEEAYTSE